MKTMSLIRWTAVTGLLCGVFLTAGPAHAQVYQGARSWGFTSIRPRTGGWGTVVTLGGYGFARDARILYDGKSITPVSMGKRAIRVKVPQGARSGWFQVAQKGRSLRAPARFVVVNAPKADTLVPSAGPRNEWITLTGRFLEAGMKFWLGRYPLTRKFIDDRTIKLFIYRGVTGGFLSYSWKGRRHRTKLRFRVRPSPMVTGFSPSTGWQGTKVTIYGRNFCPSPKVTLQGRTIHVIGVKRQGVVVEIPAGTGSGSFSLSCFGQSVAVPGRFEVSIPYATLNGMDPRQGPAGTWLLVTGRGFTRTDRFWLGKIPVTKKRFLDSSRYRLFIPRRAQTAALEFQSHDKRFVSDLRFAVLRRPTITSVQPLRGWYGSEVTLVGRDFCPDMRVTIGGRPAKVIRRTSERRVLVAVGQSARSGNVAIQCLNWKVRFARTFTLAPPKTRILSATPLTGPPGTRVVVLGSKLTAENRFFLGSMPIPSTYVGPGKVILSIPRSAQSGPIGYESYGRRLRTRFVFHIGWPRPIVASFHPAVAWFADRVTLTGRRICTRPKVTLAGKVLPVLAATDSTVRIQLPKGVKTGNLVLSCPGHRVLIRPALKVRPPFARVFSIHPTSGPWGTWVSLNGENFHRADRFFLGGRPMKSRYVASYQVRVQIPDHAQTGPIVVATKGRRMTTKHRFTISLSVPTVSGFRPSSGWYGQTLVVTGVNFCLRPRVFFQPNLPAATVVRLSHTQIRIRVPRGAKTGVIKVKCFGRTGQSARYFVLSPPMAHVTSVDPDRGGWNRWITVTGRNFTQKTKFFLGRLRLKADLRFASKGKIRLFVPPGAKTGLIYVESYGQKKDTSFSYVVRRRKPHRPRR